MQPEETIGRIEAYDDENGQARLRVKEGFLRTGDILHFQGEKRNFEESIHSLQRDGRPVRAVEAEAEAEVWVRHPVEEGTEVRRVRYPYQDNQAELLDRFFDRVGG